MFKIPLFGLSSVFYTSCTKKEPYLFIGKTHKFKNCLNLMTLGFIFQDFNLIPSLNVWENIVLPLGLDNRKVKPREVEDILKKIGLQDKKDAMPSALSGGQKQRTAIARALVTRPAIILADEPTGNLDSQTELEVMSLLKSCVSDFGQTLIMITHDETIAQMADEMIIIEDGKAVRR